MFSKDSRYILRNNQLADVICQFRFPEILIIGANPPAEFQEEIRAEFPIYKAIQENHPPRIAGAPGDLHIEYAQPTVNYQFSTPDNHYRINLTNNFISLTCSKYTCWEDFAQMLDKPLAAFIKIYKPAHFSRVGLRYLNFISRNRLNLENTPFKELFAPEYLGILSFEDLDEQCIDSCAVDTQVQLRGGCTLKLHAGPGRVRINNIPQDEIHFIFDQDVAMNGVVPINISTAALHILHSHAYSIFRDALKDTLWEAMGPEPIRR